MAKKDKNVIVEADAEGDAVLVDSGDAPNIKFIGKPPWKPLTDIHTAHREVVRLPENQEEPFFHDRAGFIIAQFPHLYKRFKAKGDR